MNKKASSGLKILLVILLIVLVWGYIGGLQAQAAGVTCDVGAGDLFCWKWHTNTVGATGEFLKNLFG